MVNYKPHLRTRVVNAPNFGKLSLLPIHDGVPSLHFSLGGLSNVSVGEWAGCNYAGKVGGAMARGAPLKVKGAPRNVP